MPTLLGLPGGGLVHMVACSRQDQSKQSSGVGSGKVSYSPLSAQPQRVWQLADSSAMRDVPHQLARTPSMINPEMLLA